MRCEAFLIIYIKLVILTKLIASLVVLPVAAFVLAKHRVLIVSASRVLSC